MHSLGPSCVIVLITQGFLQELQNSPVTFTSKGITYKAEAYRILPGLQEQDGPFRTDLQGDLPPLPK